MRESSRPRLARRFSHRLASACGPPIRAHAAQVTKSLDRECFVMLFAAEYRQKAWCRISKFDAISVDTEAAGTDETVSNHHGGLGVLAQHRDAHSHASASIFGAWSGKNDVSRRSSPYQNRLLAQNQWCDECSRRCGCAHRSSECSLLFAARVRRATRWLI